LGSGSDSGSGRPHSTSVSPRCSLNPCHRIVDPPNPGTPELQHGSSWFYPNSTGRSGLWARPRPTLLPITGPRRRGSGRIDGIRGHGTLLFGVRGSPTGFPRNEITERRFDGIFANASLFHVPSQELPRVLAELSETLRPRGVLFCSNPRGNNEEGLSGDRYSCFFDHDTWRDYVTAAGFFQVRHYYRPPGLPRHK
jgi:SAM-dependent methyltransferase